MIELYSKQEYTQSWRSYQVKDGNRGPSSLSQTGKGRFYFKLVESAILSGSIFFWWMPDSIFHFHFLEGLAKVVLVFCHTSRYRHQVDQAISMPGAVWIVSNCLGRLFWAVEM